MTKKKVETYDSGWDAIADTPAEAAYLRARAELMYKITAIVEKNVGRGPPLPSTAVWRSQGSTICCAVAARASRWMLWWTSPPRWEGVCMLRLRWREPGRSQLVHCPRQTDLTQSSDLQRGFNRWRTVLTGVKLARSATTTMH